MGFRVSARDRRTGAAVADYDTRAETEALARAEAERLGVEILALRLLPPGHDPLAAASLSEWSRHPLAWNTGAWTLLRLAFEHPRWGKVLYRNVLIPLFLLKTKVLVKWFAAALVALLAALGVRADPTLVGLLLVAVLAFVPLLATKAWLFGRLRRQHARGGVGALQQLRIAAACLDHHDGVQERRIALTRLRSVHELSHFVLLGLDGGEELAIPAAAFENAAVRRRFACALARARDLAPHLGYRSAWQGERRRRTSVKPLLVVFAMVFLALSALLILASGVGR